MMEVHCVEFRWDAREGFKSMKNIIKAEIQKEKCKRSRGNEANPSENLSKITCIVLRRRQDSSLNRHLLRL